MKWRVESADGGRWVEASGSDWTADAQTKQALDQAAGQPVPTRPGGETYTADGDSDPVWAFLAASAVIPTPHRISGQPPQVPQPAGTYPDDAVF